MLLIARDTTELEISAVRRTQLQCKYCIPRNWNRLMVSGLKLKRKRMSLLLARMHYASLCLLLAATTTPTAASPAVVVENMELVFSFFFF